MADLKITQLTADTTPTGADLVTSVKSPFGAGSNRKVTLANLAAALPALGANLVPVVLATASGAIASTVTDSAGISFNIPLSGSDATFHYWDFTVAGHSMLLIDVKGNGAGNIDYASSLIDIGLNVVFDGDVDITGDTVCDGILRLNNFVYGSVFPITATNNLILDGNSNVVSGNTQINAITNIGGLTGGTVLTLIFTGTPIVKHNTAGGGGTAKIFLAGSVDFQAALNSVLCLMFDGIQWQEISRKVA